MWRPITLLLFFLFAAGPAARAQADTIRVIKIRKHSADTTLKDSVRPNIPAPHILPRYRADFFPVGGLDLISPLNAFRLRAGVVQLRSGTSVARGPMLMYAAFGNLALFQKEKSHAGIQGAIGFLHQQYTLGAQLTPGIDYFFDNTWRMSLRPEVVLPLALPVHIWVGYELSKKLEQGGLSHAFTLSIMFGRLNMK